MRLHLVCAGRARAGAEMALYVEYARRLPWPLALREVEAKGNFAPAERRKREAKLLKAEVPPRARIVALDERGQSLSSADFAARLGRWQEAGVADLAFLIGGADGLDPELIAAAELTLSLSAMTWPHLLVRPLLAEQLYRAHTILSGHPYHRA